MRLRRSLYSCRPADRQPSFLLLLGTKKSTDALVLGVLVIGGIVGDRAPAPRRPRRGTPAGRVSRPALLAPIVEGRAVGAALADGGENGRPNSARWSPTACKREAQILRPASRGAFPPGGHLLGGSLHRGFWNRVGIMVCFSSIRGGEVYKPSPWSAPVSPEALPSAPRPRSGSDRDPWTIGSIASAHRCAQRPGIFMTQPGYVAGALGSSR